MPAARGVKRSASKSSASTASTGPKNKKKRGAIQLEIPSAPKKKGCILTCGQGDVGQLGLGEDVMETTKFKHVASLPNKMVDVCAGGMHTIALDSDGKVWTWGCNDEGALGRNTSGDSEEGKPATVALPRPAIALSAGDSHSAALLDDGNVMAWGSFRDSHGSMGLVVRGREGKPCREPYRLLLPETAVDIASGGDHLAVLTSGGAVYTMGCGEQGQLGRLAQRSATRDARQGFSALLVPSKVTLKGGASRIWAGYHATFALDASGDRLLAWGLNNYGQLGVSGSGRRSALYAPVECDLFPARTWRRLAPGQHHTLALDTSGAVWAVGRCEYGRLGLGDRTGDAETPEQIPKLQNKKCISIAAGTSNSFAVTDSGEMFAWGMGSEGQLGTGGSSDAAEPAPAQLEPRRALAVAAGGQHTALLAEDPSAQKETSPVPEKETEEEKVEKTEQKIDEEEEEEEKKQRPTKRQKKQEQDEEISSTSSAQAETKDLPPEQPDKVNGDEKKETEMEVDEPNNVTEKVEEDSKEDKQTDEQTTDTKEIEPEPEKETKDTIETMDTSSQDTVESDKPAELNGAAEPNEPAPAIAPAVASA